MEETGVLGAARGGYVVSKAKANLEERECGEEAGLGMGQGAREGVQDR